MMESSRMRMEAQMTSASLPRRRSSLSSNHSMFAAPETLDPEDFSDVFGGPPRSVFWRKKSGDFAPAFGGGNSFYEEIFCPEEIRSSGELGGRGLPAFRIPGTSERFYSDVFGSDSVGEDRLSRERSRTTSLKEKSKSTSSSVLSSEEMSPLRLPIGEHVPFSDFASKLRPINVPSRRDYLPTRAAKVNVDTLTNSSRKQNMPSFYTNRPCHVDTAHLMETDQRHWSFGRSQFGFSRRVSSPETTISLGPDSYPSLKVSVEDADLNSPASSVVSSVSLRAKSDGPDPVVVEEEDDDDFDDDDDDDEMMSSYVIEIGSGGSDQREGTCDAVCIDEAIAWAKEKFQTHVASEKELNKSREEDSKVDQGHNGRANNAQNFTDQQMDKSNEIVQESPKMETKHLDENIRLWSVGKEADIRLLLSTLHYILWNNSGWSTITLSNLIESSKVKKAYQKARLCLHPDKLQQRAATLPQKYVADKAFSILQDAWATFISQDVSFH